MDTWKVVGFEKWMSERGDECVRLFLVRPLHNKPGYECEGFETQRPFYKPMYLKTKDYVPQVGQLIVAVEGRLSNSLEQIFVVGFDKPNQGA